MARRTDRAARLRPLEILERRALFARGSGNVVALAVATPRPDLDDWVRALVARPGWAARGGLADLVRALDAHPGVAARYGPGTLLAWTLRRHPYYAQRHGLTALLADPAASASGVGRAATPVAAAAPAGPAGLTADVASSSSPLFNVPGDTAVLMTGCNGCQPTADSAGDAPGDGLMALNGLGLGGGASLPGTRAGDGGAMMLNDVGMVTGELFRSAAIPGYTSQAGTRALDVEYSSLQAAPDPVIQFQLTINNSPLWPTMTKFTATISLNGVSQGTATYNTPGGVTSGSSYRVPLQANAAGLSTGIYTASISDLKTYSGGSTQSGGTTNADFMVVNNAGSPLGAGWTFGGLQKLTVGVAGSSVMVTAGAQGTEEYTSADGTHYTGPHSDPSTLTKNAGGTWTRTYPDGSYASFDASGRQTAAVDRDGNATSYGYVASGPAAGSLATATDPTGKVTTVAYDGSGHLATITDPAGRVTTYTVDAGGDLAAITAPDGAVTSFTYSAHRLTSSTEPAGGIATIAYDGFHRVAGETLPGGDTTGTMGAETDGLMAAGGTASAPLPMSSYKGEVTDPAGRTTTLTFNFMGHPTQLTDPAGKVTTVVYDTNGRPVQVTDPLNRTTSYAYDAVGDVTQVTRPDGSSMAIAYDATHHQPTQITDYRGLITTFTLNGNGDVTRRTDPDGNHEDWTYNAAGQVLTDTDRNGHTVSYGYDAAGNPATVTEPDAGAGIATISYGYNAAGDVTSVTDALGHASSMTYDAAGRLLSAADPVQVAASVRTSLAYDADGNLTSVTDALGHVTSYLYDGRDRLVGVVDPINQGTGHRTTLTWGAYDLRSVTDPNGHTVSFTYDSAGRAKTVEDALHEVTTLTYDDAGQLLAVIDPNGHATSYAYDALGRVTTLTLPGTAPGPTGALVPVAYTYGYNADDQPTSVTDAFGHTATTTYDNLGRASAVTDALGHAVSYGYDLDGNRTSVTDPLGHVTSSTYDARDRLASETAPSGGGTTTYTYDQADRLTSLEDADSNTTGWGYDAAGRVTTETDPRGKVTTTAYDLVGNATQTTDRDGRVIHYGYDADNRPTTEAWINGGTTLRTITTTYDPGGRMTAIQDPDSHYAYTYDDANRLLTVDDAGTTGLPQVTLTYGYDPAGNRTSLDDSRGGLTSYTYDARDELTELTQSGSGVSSKRVDFAYDAAQRLTTLTRYADLAGSTTVLVTKYGYDAANRLTTLVHQTAGGTVRASYGYTLDAASRVTQEARTWDGGASTDTLSYTYTDDGQLTGVTHTNGAFAGESFGYDATGNRTMTGYSTSTGNRLASDGTYNYAYDDEGNLTSKTAIATGNQTLYSYDYRNRLVEVDSKPSGGSTTVLATYTYDALDRRIGVREGGATTWTAYDGTAPILDFDGSGTKTARRLYGPAVDEILARETPSGGVAWYLTDRLGTVRDLANNSGAIVDHVDYNAFGQVIAETAPTLGDRFKFTGRELDPVTGLQYSRARYYDPAVGRWMQEDPLGFAGGSYNMYSYVNNDSTDFLDPVGLLAYPPLFQLQSNPFESDYPYHQVDAMLYWNAYLDLISHDSDFKSYRGGCIGLLKMRFGISDEDGQFERTDKLTKYYFNSPEDALSFLEKLEGNKKNNARVFAFQIDDVVEKIIVDKENGIIDPIKIAESRLGGARWNYATWHAGFGTPYWEWMNKYFIPGKTKALVKHAGKLPNFDTTIYGIAIIPESRRRACLPLAYWDKYVELTDD